MSGKYLVEEVASALSDICHLTPQSLKSVLVPRPQILGQLGPPKNTEIATYQINDKNAYFVYFTRFARTYMIDISLATY